MIKFSGHMAARVTSGRALAAHELASGEMRPWKTEPGRGSDITVRRWSLGLYARTEKTRGNYDPLRSLSGGTDQCTIHTDRIARRPCLASAPRGCGKTSM